MENIGKDERFAHIATDPRFRRLPKAQRKVKIEKRFQGMFNDDNFKVKYSVDKRGRPVQHSSNEDLKRFYELSSEDDSHTDDDEIVAEETTSEEPGKFVRAPPKEPEKKITETIKKKLQDLTVDYARGEASLLSESSSSDEASEDEGHETDEENITHDWGELDKDADFTEDATYRLAACNMDWDRIRAVDLMVLFSSFLPPGGLIKSISIYPSEFGLERMKEEEVNGPLELVSHKEKIDVEIDEDSDNENEEGSKYHMEKLRKYQLNRLKYYYAVIECDSTKTANILYTECDGREYESSSTKLDLRFIPDDMTFEQEVKEVCTELPDLSKYEPRYFTTTALQQAKVNLTWDETNPTRIEIAQKLQTGKVDDISEADLQDYLASSSGDENESDEYTNAVSADQDTEKHNKNSIDKYKALLLDIEKNEEDKKNRDVEMEITWGVDLKEKTEKLVKEKLGESSQKLTPFEKYLEKRKDKRKAKKAEKQKKLNNSDEDLSSDDEIPDGIDMNDSYFAEEFKNGDFKQKKEPKKKLTQKENDEEDAEKAAELELLLMNEVENDKKHFNMKKIEKQQSTAKKKKKRHQVEEVDDNFELDVTDERFVTPIVKSHHFNIDPADPAFRRTKGMQKLISEKLKRRATESDELEPEGNVVKRDRKHTELNMLIKSVKRKNTAFKRKK